ncbi:hypothetical protein FEP72_02987 [Burkholderia multivorans]|nr:hypothetical protein [Burkholderia multivorans]MDR8936714.1 hypothetical protein [Burkholderia multivorans]MDR8970989.1 hypothetical protein [Burkholderia multivorans]MDR9009197.1 hypothetical protein [Burkholderia multivorans]
MAAHLIQFTQDEPSHWAGMEDYVLIPPDRSYEIVLWYEGEPPHGDSYYVLSLRDRRLPGFAWGCMFSMSACSNFLAFSWTERRFERLTAVVDVRLSRYFVLPSYIYHPRIECPVVLDAVATEQRYEFSGNEAWRTF